MIPPPALENADQATTSEDFQAADVKTLRLSAPGVTDERLDQLLAFQRAWLEAVKRHGKDGLALAQKEALEGTELPARLLGELEAMVRDFCGKRWSGRVLAKRFQELSAKQQQGLLTPSEAAKLARLEEERPTLEALPALDRRYGREAVALLCAREEELLTLHQAVGAALL